MMNNCNWVIRRYEDFYDENEYLPFLFVPYDAKEVEISPARVVGGILSYEVFVLTVEV